MGLSDKIRPLIIGSAGAARFGLTSLARDIISHFSGKDIVPNRNSAIDNIFRDKVQLIKGCVVCCDLGPLPLGAVGIEPLDHSGIYVGDGKIAHRDGGGFLALVSPQEFLKRLGGLNAAMSLYVSCCDQTPIGLDMAAERAIMAVYDRERAGYNLLTKNCHHFSQYCVTGVDENSVFKATFSSLVDTLKKYYGMNNWRVWDEKAWQP